MSFRQIVLCDDYHDFAYIAESMVGMQLESQELGNIGDKQHGFKYVGIIYEGNKPEKAEIEQMLVDLDFTLND